ncbi:hypothetical protein SNE40_019813 [Patella caerulea]|uniref:Uncharacterized protein n=1 Tax=Patella caerulea TaxID=87958 RepID=A0AAN8G6D7_PATCE
MGKPTSESTKRKNSSTSSDGFSPTNLKPVKATVKSLRPATKKNKINLPNVDNSMAEGSEYSLETIMQEIKLNRLTMDNIKNEIVKSVEDQLLKLQLEIQNLKDENITLKNLLEGQSGIERRLQSELEDAKGIAAVATKRVNDLEQWTRRSGIRIYGVADKDPTEDFNDSINLAIKVIKSIGIEIPPHHIDIYISTW